MSHHGAILLKRKSQVGLEFEPVHLLHAYSKLYNPSKSVHSILPAINSSPKRADPVPAVKPHKTVRRLQSPEIDELVRRYRTTKNMRELAREFQISRTTVAKHLKDRGVDSSRGMKPAQIAKAKELYAQGLGSGQIGKLLGFDNKTILKAVKS